LRVRISRLITSRRLSAQEQHDESDDTLQEISCLCEHSSAGDGRVGGGVGRAKGGAGEVGEGFGRVRVDVGRVG
jgi:hypothetical protein